MSVEISIVIPLLNEVESIPALCEKLTASLKGLGKSYEVIIVDDGSTDGSWDLLKSLQPKHPGFRLIRLRRNFGQTAALSAGFASVRGDIVITLDADLQNDPGDIPLLLTEMAKGADVVSGWRKNRQDAFINRKLPSMIANGLISRITGVHLHDYGCTLKAYHREVIENLKLYGEMHRFIPALASWVGAKVVEIPVNHHARQFGRSKYGISRTLRVFLDLLTVKFLLHYSSHPIQIFGKIGLSFGIPGVLMFLYVFGWHIHYMIFGALPDVTPMIKRPFWVLAPFMLIMLCIQFISIGLLAELQIRTYHESQSKPPYVIRERSDD